MIHQWILCQLNIKSNHPKRSHKNGVLFTHFRQITAKLAGRKDGSSWAKSLFFTYRSKAELFLTKTKSTLYSSQTIYLWMAMMETSWVSLSTLLSCPELVEGPTGSGCRDWEHRIMCQSSVPSWADTWTSLFFSRVLRDSCPLSKGASRFGWCRGGLMPHDGWWH